MTDEKTRRRFEQLALPHLDAAYNLARWLTRNDHDAQDVVQEACLRALRYFESFRGEQARPWLLQIVRHTCYSWLQQNRPADVVGFDAEDESSRPEAVAPAADEPMAVAVRNADRALINRAIAALPISFREVLVLRELEDLSYKEIARIADIPLGTVMSRLSRARALLQQALQPGARPVLRDVSRSAQGGNEMSTDRIPVQELSAFVDGELALTEQLDLEARLAGDAALRDAVEHLRSLRDAVRSRADYHAAPDALRARLLPPAASPTPAPVRVARFDRHPWLAWRPLGIAFAVAGLLVWALSLTFWQPGRDQRLMQEVIASHVRSTIGQRLVDVASSDQHTVKPWLAAKLDFSPPVADLPMPGLSFIGGRVDYLDGRPVAALVYRQRQHVIDAYIWPAPQSDTTPGALSQRGFNSVQWVRGGMRFWLISDLNRDELAGFARALAHADAAR